MGVSKWKKEGVERMKRRKNERGEERKVLKHGIEMNKRRKKSNRVKKEVRK